MTRPTPPARQRRGRTTVVAAFAALLLGSALPTVAGATTDPPPSFADSFDRADGALGTSDTGQAWEQWSGSISVAGGAAEASPTGYSLAVADSGVADGAFSVAVQQPASEFWIVLRASDSGNYWRFGRWFGGGYTLQQVTNHALGAPPISAISPPPPVSAGDVLGCRLEGPTISCAVNGTTVLTTTSDFNRSATRVGLASYEGGASPARFDDARVVMTGGPVDPVPPPAAGDRLVDSFDRPDASQLGAADTGQLWTSWYGGIGVVSGQAGPLTGGYSLSVIDGGAADGRVAATVPALAPEFWLVIRASDAANYWRFGRWNDSTYTLQQVVNHNLGTPPVVLVDTQPTAGDQLACEMRGSTISCSVNGALVASVEDDFNSSARMIGLAAYGSSTPPVRFDELSSSDLTAPDDAAPALSLALSGTDPVVTGAGMIWTATVANAGSGAADEVTLTGAIPDGVEITSVVTTQGSCTIEASLSCALGTIPPGTSASVTLYARAPSTAGSLTTTLTVATTTDGDLDPSDDVATVTTTVQAPPQGTRLIDAFDRPDLDRLAAADTGQLWTSWSGAVGVRSGAAAPLTGGYSVAVVDTGSGNGTASVRVAELSSELWLIVRGKDPGNYWRFGRSNDSSYVLQQVIGGGLGSPPIQLLASPQPSPGDVLACHLNGPSIACSVNGTATASVQDDFNAGAGLAGVAAYASSPPPVRFDEFSVVDVGDAADLAVRLVDVDPVLVGGAMAWTATVTNIGGRTADAVVLTGAAPDLVSAVTAQASIGTCTVTPALECDLGSLDPGETATVHLQATAPADANTLTTTVSVAMAATDPNPTDNSATQTTTVRTPPPPGARLTDWFERPDAPDLGTADSGEQWNVPLGGFRIESGTARPSGSDVAIAALDGGFAFGSYDLKVDRIGDGKFWALFRYVDQDNHFRVGRDPWSGFYRVEKVLGGQVTGMQFNVVRADVAPADGDIIRIVTRPDDGFFVSINGIHVVDGGDTDLMTAGGFGFRTDSDQPVFGFVDAGQMMTASTAVRDSFDDVDGAELGAPDVGVAYRWLNTVSSAWLIENGHAYHPGSHKGVVRLDTSSELADVRVSVPRVSADFGVVFRLSEDGSHYRFGRITGAPHYGVEFVGGNGLPVPVPQLESITPADGDVLEVLQELDGSIRTIVNGTVTHEWTDSTTNARWTLYGLSTFGSDARFDDFEVTPK